MNTLTIESPLQLEETDSVTVTVVQAIAERAGVDPTTLPPLTGAIDPDALESLFAPRATGRVRTGQVEFSYVGYRVTVRRAESGGIAVDVEAANDSSSVDGRSDR